MEEELTAGDIIRITDRQICQAQTAFEKEFISKIRIKDYALVLIVKHDEYFHGVRAELSEGSIEIESIKKEMLRLLRNRLLSDSPGGSCRVESDKQ